MFTHVGKHGLDYYLTIEGAFVTTTTNATIKERTFTPYLLGVLGVVAALFVGLLFVHARSDAVAAAPAVIQAPEPAPVVAAPVVPEPPSTAFVKLYVSGDHGSGVHIGDGYILTAAHVTTGQKTLTLKGSDGKSQSATLLWENKDYDVALMRASKPEHLAAVPLSCAPNFSGQDVVAEGNPIDLEFLRTYGKVIGGPRKVANWLNVVPVNMAIVGGMSGGGVTSDGAVVGIVVSVMGTSLGMAAIGMIVPAETICMLLARR